MKIKEGEGKERKIEIKSETVADAVFQISGFVDGGRGVQGGSLLLDDAVSFGVWGKGEQGCDAYA